MVSIELDITVCFFFIAAFDFIGHARPLQVAAVATDESCRAGEDGPHCSGRWGVLVHLFLLFVIGNSYLVSCSDLCAYNLCISDPDVQLKSCCFPLAQDGFPGLLPPLHRRGGVPSGGESAAVAQLSLEGGALLWRVGPGSCHPTITSFLLLFLHHHPPRQLCTDPGEEQQTRGDQAAAAGEQEGGPTWRESAGGREERKG